MQGQFLITKDGSIGLIKDAVGVKEYSNDKLVNERTILYIYDDIKGQNSFYLDEVEVKENIYNVNKN